MNRDVCEHFNPVDLPCEKCSVQKSTLREAAQQALEALIENARLLGVTQAKKGFGCYSQEDARLERAWHEGIAKHSDTLRAALAEPMQETNIKESLTTGSCIACGNRMTGSPESFVVATAEVGVTAPEGYSLQQVEALHPHKGGDKTAPPLAEPVQEPLTIERLRDALVASRIIPPAAVEDPDEYDDGVTLFRIEALHRRIT